MSTRDDVVFYGRVIRAFRAANVIRPLAPGRVRRAVRSARALQATPAASIAIAAACDPDGLAIADERGTLTWEQLDRRVRALAHALASRYDAGPSRPVAVMCRNHGGVIEALGAAARAGADVLALNTELTAPQVAAALAPYDVAVVVRDDEFASRLDDAVAQVSAWTDGSEPEWEALARASVDLDAAPGHRSRITILTSGTTGVPKGASRDMPAKAMLGPITTLIERLGLRRGEPVLVAPPLFHGLGLGLASIAQAIGAPIVLRRRFDARETLELVECHRVACLVGVPVMLQRVLEEREHAGDMSSLTAVLSAGAPLSPHLSTAFMDAFGDIVFNAYGSTETGFGSIATPQDLRAAPGTIGRAPLGTRLAVLDDARQPAAVNEVGHVFVGGDLVIDGYTGGGSKELAAGMMNTGDLGHCDEAGLVFVDGREDDMIVSGGENVFPQEVEDALAAHPAVSDATVVGVDDEEFGQRLRAYVVGTASSDELLAHLRGRLERYKLPREIVFCEEIPRTPTGKVMRRLLNEQQEEPRESRA